MPTEIAVALISSVVGGILVAIVNHLFTRKRTEAEADKIKAEAEKLRAEAEKIKSEIFQASKEISRASTETKDAVEQAVKEITAASLSESEASRKLIQEVIRNIHKYLQEMKSERCERRELINVVSSMFNNNMAMSDFIIENLINRGYLIETSPSRYEISRTARQKFISGGAK